MVTNLRASFRSEFLVRLKFFFYITFVSQDSAHRSAIYIEGLKVAQEILEASEFLLPQRSKIEGLSHCKIYAGLCSLSPSFRASARAIASFQYLLSDLLLTQRSFSSIAASSLKHFSYKGHFVRDWSVLMKSPKLFCLAQ